MWTVTLKQLREHHACVEGYNKVVCMISGKEVDEDRETYMRFKHDGDICLIDIANNNGIDDALWATRCISGADRDLRLFAVWCARQVQHLMEDDRSINAIAVAEKFANGEATDDELNSARAAAWAASCDAAWAAARDAAWAASCDAARAAAGSAACDAAWDAARDAAWAAAWDAARDAARATQKEMFIKMCRGEAPWQLKE